MVVERVRAPSLTPVQVVLGYTCTVPYKDPERQREYQRKWQAARRAAWLAENGPCVDCGTWENLEVDHADANTKVDHRVWSWSDARRVVELAKCVVRCYPCHMAKSVQERAKGEDHGGARLTTANVLAIRASALTRRQLAAQYGVGVSTIQGVVSRRTWKHV
jgi:hypothetical protein